MKIGKNELIAALAGVSGFIAVIENLLPIPVPFVKFGLSNIPVCLGFPFLKWKELLFLVFFKLIVSHIFKGTLFSFPFIIALLGNLLFLFFTLPFFFIFCKRISFLSVSVLGALTHNYGQMIAALLFLPVSSVFIIGLIMLPVGIITGTINGILCNWIYRRYKDRIILWEEVSIKKRQR